MSRQVTRRYRLARHDGFSRTGTVLLVAGIFAVGGLAGATVVAATSGTSRPGASGRPVTTTSSTPQHVTTTTSRQQAVARLLSLVTMSPASGTTAKPGGTVTLTAAGARLDDVVLKTATGSAGTTSSSRPTTSEVPGKLASSGQVWHSTGLLLPSMTYLVSYEVSGADGLTAQVSTSFKTAAPSKPVSVSIWPAAGLSVGVGEPIEFTFSQPLTASAEKKIVSRISIAMSKPVPGGWHWFSPTSLHFRPTHFWPTGEQVQATVNLSGLQLGGGEWGVGGGRTQFVIGAAHISVANLATHEMTVYDNGQAIYQWPISAGAPKWPTQDGVHIVLDRTSRVQMISSTVGIPVNSPEGYDETVYWDTQISYSGEYVHAAPWSVSEQGLENVSHGCINLSPARAETFFRFSRVGDVVDVIDGSRPPLVTDGGVMDWAFPPSEVSWAPAKVGQLTTSVTTLPTTTEPPPAGAPTTDSPVPTVAGLPALAGVPGLPAPAVPTTTTTVPPTTTTALPSSTVTTLPVTTLPATTLPVTTLPATTEPTSPLTSAAPTSPGATSSTRSAT